MERSHPQPKGVRPGLILILVAIVAVVVGAIVLRSRTGPARPTETAAASPEPAAPAPVPVPDRARPAPVKPRPPAVTPPPAAAIPAPPVEPMPDWSSRLDDVLGSADAEPAKAAQLLEMWPGLPPDGQIEVMQHIANLLADDQFHLLHHTFTNARTQEAVLDVIMTDALNRPNGIKLPALLEVARADGHPKSAEARDILEVFVEADHGTDWTKWEQAVQKFLKDNPDEGPPEPAPPAPAQ